MKYDITTFPYAVQHGTIEVPDTVPEEEVETYVEDHWDSIKFSDPDLDYAGTDFLLDQDTSDYEKEERYVGLYAEWADEHTAKSRRDAIEPELRSLYDELATDGANPYTLYDKLSNKIQGE